MLFNVRDPFNAHHPNGETELVGAEANGIPPVRRLGDMDVARQAKNPLVARFRR